MPKGAEAGFFTELSIGAESEMENSILVMWFSFWVMSVRRKLATLYISQSGVCSKQYLMLRTTWAVLKPHAALQVCQKKLKDRLRDPALLVITWDHTTYPSTFRTVPVHVPRERTKIEKWRDNLFRALYSRNWK